MLTRQVIMDEGDVTGTSLPKPTEAPAKAPPEMDSSNKGESRVNILLVDDTPENLIALEAVLAELNQNLVKARSGEEALRLILKQDFAVILLDVNMPGLTGFETAELIRQRKSTEHIPIIFVSAISTSDTHLFKGYSLGAVDYIFTPVIPEVLRSKVSVFVELLKNREETQRQSEQLRAIEEREHQRKLNEAARRIELQTKQNRFFTLAVDLLAIADFKGYLKELNPAWSRVLGFPEEILKSKPFWDLVPEEERQEVVQHIAASARTSKNASFETRYLCSDGSDRWLSWTIAPYGAERLLYLFARDMTERKRAEQQIQKLNRDLEVRANELQSTNAELQAEIVFRKRAEAALQDSNSALEAFSYSVSHDLRAPLRAMQGFAKVLLEDYGNVLDETGRDCASRIVNASERMDTLVQDLLVYARLGHTTLDLTPIELDHVLIEILQQLEPEIRAKNVSVEVQQPLPKVLAHGVTITQVLINLLSNGIKFVAPGVDPKITVCADLEGKDALLWIKDNGIGIQPEDRTRIFRVFERLNGADIYPGTGLGLAIVRKGIERMGGQVGLDSKPGEGSHFWIRLPLA